MHGPMFVYIQSPLILLLNFLQSSVSTVFGLKAAGSEAWSTYVSISHTVQTGYLGRLLGQGVLTQYPLLPMNGDLLLPWHSTQGAMHPLEFYHLFILYCVYPVHIWWIVNGGHSYMLFICSWVLCHLSLVLVSTLTGLHVYGALVATVTPPTSSPGEYSKDLLRWPGLHCALWISV